MQEITNGSLLRITKGAGVAFIGFLAALLLGFFGRILVARYGSEADYGVFALALAVLGVCAVVATLGLQEGATRSIAFARGKNDDGRVQRLIPASIQIALAASVSLSVILFFTSDILATEGFRDPDLSFPLKVFALGIPFLTLTNVLVSIFRGFDNLWPKVLFQDVLRSLLFFPMFLLIVVFFDMDFAGVFYAYLASLAIACIGLAAYAAKRLPTSAEPSTQAHAGPVAKELLFFSLPLLGVAVLQMIVAWTDTLMLGGFKTSADVGVYNAALPLAQFISARGLLPEIRRNYRVLTKWLCSLTLPLFLIIFLFPETVLDFLFGADYSAAALALRILAFGFIINNFLGPNGATLIALGEVRFLMMAALATVILNIGLNVALIPPLGIEGAAIASVASITLVNLLRSWKLYSLIRCQPLSRNLMKPTLASIGLVFAFYFVSTMFTSITIWMLPLLLVLYYATYCVAIIATRSFDREDIDLLLNLERRLGIDASLAKRVLRRFL
jgi:O-antigen/teichoic acid export membrane protein